MGPVVRLPFVNTFRSRHGRLVSYFRKRGCRTMRLRGIPGSPEFMRAYAAALGDVKPVAVDRAKAGTVAATVDMYLSSAAFADLADETQKMCRGILERFRKAHGTKRIATIKSKHVQALIDAKAATPNAARDLLSVIRLLMKFAIDTGIRFDDPTLAVFMPDVNEIETPPSLKLYVAHPLDTTRFKVGVTKNGEARRRDLQIGSPFKLEFICMVEIESQEVETKAHDSLLHWHCHGEWFDLGPQANAFRRAVQRCQEATEVLDVFDRLARPAEAAAAETTNDQQPEQTK
jgi:hypothetical protein